MLSIGREAAGRLQGGGFLCCCPAPPTAHPPERKWMPGTEAGMVRSMVRTVYLATSAGGAGSASRPAGGQQQQGRAAEQRRMLLHRSMTTHGWLRVAGLPPLAQVRALSRCGRCSSWQEPCGSAPLPRKPPTVWKSAGTSTSPASARSLTRQAHVGLEQDSLQQHVVLVQQPHHVAALARASNRERGRTSARRQRRQQRAGSA